MMVKFKIGFTIGAETLFGLMAKVLPIDDLHVEEVYDQPSRATLPGTARAKRAVIPAVLRAGKPPAKRKRQSKGPVLTEGINGIITKVLEDGMAHHSSELAPLIKAAGFSGNSVASRLQSLQEHGVVKRLGAGRWRLTDAYIPKKSA